MTLNIEPRHTVFLSGGLGDILALLCWIPDYEWLTCKEIVFATRAWKSIENVLPAISATRHIQRYRCVCDDAKLQASFPNGVVMSVPHLLSRPEFAHLNPSCLSWLDWSIMYRFQQAIEGKLEKHRPSWMNGRLADVAKFSLPEKYCVVCPTSPYDKEFDRDFDGLDWDATIELLHDWQLPGVILGTEAVPFPSNSQWINLSRQTNACEAMEITKNASGYIGINTALSVVAAWACSPERLLVRNRVEHCFRWRRVYFPAQKSFDFLVGSINEGLMT